MDMPVKSKVEEIILRPHEFLLPIFEVIVNAIISIQAKAQKHGLITISVTRDKQNNLFSEMQSDSNFAVPYSTIDTVTVTDNGGGFDDDNFRSFNTAYSDRHKERGCKGVGRFTMLACFNSVTVESVYKNGSDNWVRKFTFDVKDEVYPKDGAPELLNGHNISGTSVSLTNYKTTYKLKSNISTRQLAEAIIDHCLPFFLSNTPVTVVLKNNVPEEQVVLNDILKEVITFDGSVKHFHVEGTSEQFNVQVIKRAGGQQNRLKLCAHNRVVGKAKNLESLSPEFAAPMRDASGTYYIDVYVTSHYLDKTVNGVRNSFNITDDDEGQQSIIKEVTLRSIEQGVLDILLKKYADIIEVLQQETLAKVRRYILNPQKIKLKYKSLLSRPDLLKQIPYGSSGDKLEEHLFKIKITLEKEMQKNLQYALKKVNPEDYDEYSSSVKKYIDQEARFAKDKLTDLVIHRKGVLQLLKQLIKLNKLGKYELEATIHNIIFPMGTDDQSMPYDNHNLWLLDERLAFHSYVGSDKKLRSNKDVSLESKKEADILIFDFPWAFSEQERELTSMAVFEFKRPGRDVSTENEGKLDALVQKYFEDLSRDKAKSQTGELLNLEKSTPKFGFIICDVDKGLIEYNTEWNGFRKTPYKTLYKLNDVLNLHIEVMTYQQMIDMCERRHHAFFKALGMDEL